MRAGAGAAAGAIVVFLGATSSRAEIGPGERGLPLVCRAGPAGAAPGGAGFTQGEFTLRGLHARPWSPTGLAIAAGGGGLTVRWTPRVRLYGDSWDGEPTPVEPMRFRIRVVDGEAVMRTMEAEETMFAYSAADLASDFPAGAPASARIAVAQWGEGFGWGVEAEIRLA